MGERESGLQKCEDHGMMMTPEVMSVDTFGGRMQVQWDTESNATSMGQLAFFAEFLKEAGTFDEWVGDCPLSYTSPNAPSNRDILGTWMLSALAGHRRYSHVTALRGDGVSPQVLGMRRIVSEDALRRALCRIDEEKGTTWMRRHLMRSIAPALSVPWILDADTTIKTLYGRQEGAEIGYNPKKPGRPSHAYHTYWVGDLRLALDVEVSGGKSHTGSHALPGLTRLLEELPPEQRPFLVRGDCGFGNDTILRDMESHGQRYLFKLKQSKNVRRLLARQFQRHDWINAGQGWESVEDEVRLAGWEKARRVVILRRLFRKDLALAKRKDRQVDLLFPEFSDTVCYEYAVLVTDTSADPAAIAQLYRDRADSENGFDLPAAGRRDEESVGVGRLHHAGPCALPPYGSHGSAGLQLVELVQPHGPAGCPAGGDHGSSAAAGGCRPDSEARWAKPLVPDADARRRTYDRRPDRQRTCGFAICTASCGAVALQGSLARSGSLYRRPDSGGDWRCQAKIAPPSCLGNRLGGGVTAVFRIMRNELSFLSACLLASIPDGVKCGWR